MRGVVDTWGIVGRRRPWPTTECVLAFALLLEAQGYACAMCHVPFEEGQQIAIDHDHTLGCHPGEKHACDACRRGLLCLRCNTGLGYIERMSDMARAYLSTVSRVGLV